MGTLDDNYLNAYRSLRLTRDAAGVLVAEFHSNGGPFTFTAPDHTELVDAFYRIAQDRSNKIVILTGVGGEFIPSIDFSSFGNVADPGVWSRIHDEGIQILEKETRPSPLVCRSRMETAPRTRMPPSGRCRVRRFVLAQCLPNEQNR
jgi:hypothetical protein